MNVFGTDSVRRIHYRVTSTVTRHVTYVCYTVLYVLYDADYWTSGV